MPSAKLIARLEIDARQNEKQNENENEFPKLYNIVVDIRS